MEKVARIRRVDMRRPDPEAIGEAACRLREGCAVIFPTETVYGIGVMPDDEAARERVVRAKQRDAGKPFQLLVTGIGEAAGRGGDFGGAAGRLARRYWPGPLTLVVRLERGGFDGFRAPDHAIAQALLQAVGGALRATSANVSGARDSVTAAEAVRALGDVAAMALNGGRCLRGKPSTVVRVDGSHVEVLREGAIRARDVAAVAEGRGIVFICTGNVCRSPMAEYLMKQWLGSDSGWRVESAGVAAAPGFEASYEAIEVLRERGLDASAHRSRPLTAGIIDDASLLVVMTAAHRDEVIRRYPAAADKVRLLGSFGAEGGDASIPDPIGMSVDVYRQTRDRINGYLPNLVLYLHERFDGANGRR